MINLMDTRHFGEAQWRNIEKINFSPDAIPGDTSKDKQCILKCLALHMKSRCNAEWNAAYKLYHNNMDMLKNKLSFAIDAIIDCYDGICGTNCRKHSFCCKGRKRSKWDHSYLNDCNRPLCLSENDKQQIRVTLNTRLGKDAVEKTRFNTNTQYSEAAHRAYTSTKSSARHHVQKCTSVNSFSYS